MLFFCFFLNAFSALRVSVSVLSAFLPLGKFFFSMLILPYVLAYTFFKTCIFRFDRLIFWAISNFFDVVSLLFCLESSAKLDFISVYILASKSVGLI